MKKNNLLLLAGVCTLMTGCGGTKYVNTYSEALFEGASISYSETLTLSSSSFNLEQVCSMSISDEVGKYLLGGGVEASYKFTYTGTAVQDATTATKWTLTPDVLYVSDYTCTGTGAATINELFKAQFSEYFTAETVNYIMNGEKVQIALEGAMKAPLTVNVNDTTYTFTY